MGVLATSLQDYPGKPGSAGGSGEGGVKAACQDIRDDLVQCLIRTDWCVRVPHAE